MRKGACEDLEAGEAGHSLGFCRDGSSCCVCAGQGQRLCTSEPVSAHWLLCQLQLCDSGPASPSLPGVDGEGGRTGTGPLRCPSSVCDPGPLSLGLQAPPEHRWDQSVQLPVTTVVMVWPTSSKCIWLLSGKKVNFGGKNLPNRDLIHYVCIECPLTAGPQFPHLYSWSLCLAR